MKNLKVKEIVDWTQGKVTNANLDEEISLLSRDTRTIKNGEIYIALKGRTLDGHDYTNAAFENGASYAICSSLDKVDDKYKDKVILVNDTQEALNDISRNYIKKYNVPVLAITGSIGKTTQKEMMYSVLSQEKKCLKTNANMNNTIGAPYTALELDETYEFAIIEAGMNHFDELASISRAINPDYCLITNIGESHIGNLGSKDGIFKAKCEIFSNMKENGTLFLNGDDEYLRRLEKDHNCIYASNDEIVDSIISDDKSSITYKLNNGFEFKINSLSSCYATAALLSYKVAKHLGYKDDSIKKGIEEFKNIENRLDIKQINGITLINDTYNACYASIESGIKTACNIKNDDGRIICFLGDVKELGDYSKDIHTNIGEMLNNYKLDKVLFQGEDIINAFNSYNSEKEFFDNKDVLLESIKKENYKAGDVIYVKASNSCKFIDIVHKFEEIL